MNKNITYDLTSSTTTQSMNPIGLTFNFYNSSLFKEIDESEPGTEGPLHNPKDKNMNYASADAPYHSGAVAGKMESTVIDKKPIKKKEVKTKDMYTFLQEKILDRRTTIFDPSASGINGSFSREQKFESSNSQAPGNNQMQAYRMQTANIDNPNDYNFAEPKKSYVGFLAKHYEKLADKLEKSNSKTVTLKADDQKKAVPNPDHKNEISVASQYAWSKNNYGSVGAEGNFPVSY